jgi:hypothetical protein
MYALKITTATILFLFTSFLSVKAQNSDLPAGEAGSTFQGSIQADTLTKIINFDSPVSKKNVPFKSLIIPGAMITYGFISIGNNNFKKLNHEFQEDIWIDKPHQSKHYDNYLMFAPALSVYGLNIAGINGKNNLRDRTMIYLLSSIIQNTTVFSIKKLSSQLRPDSSGYTSFPSGHTATAFASAEFLYQEYKNVSLWYGVAGYTMAAATGYLRMYNNKHWFSDVIAGAGIGILSTKVAYWIYPAIKRKLFKNKPMNTMILPFYQKGGGGLSLVCNFNQ